ncbi:MAG: septum formation initiator family protein [Lachnospiraceae bacterium]|nr:septum formation initiator family protein [Lachnospiraceae bacterium]
MVRKVYMSARRKKQRKSYLVTITLVLLLIVLGFNMVKLYSKNRALEAREEYLNKQIEDEEDRYESLTEYEKFTKTIEFVEKIAREKLGLVFGNEIIFKEK